MRTLKLCFPPQTIKQGDTANILLVSLPQMESGTSAPIYIEYDGATSKLVVTPDGKLKLTD